LLFSATLDGAVDVLVRRYQRHPVRHELVGSAEEDAHTEHYFWRVESTDRAEMTAQIAAVSGPTIVFCRTRHSADRTARQLMARGIRAVAIHGDRSQSQRERALSSFAAGHAGALVATDVAARGIHVDGVAAVVHFDPPADAKDYVHRSGRTARAGATGIVVSLVTPDKTKAVKLLQRDLGVPAGIVGPDLATLPTGGTAVSRRQKPVGRPSVAATGATVGGSGRATAPRRRRRPPVHGRKHQPQRRAG
jgi:superfamily II DNA/RNA helicase